MSPSRRGFLGFIIAAPIAARLPVPAAAPMNSLITAQGTAARIVGQSHWVTALDATVRPAHRVIR